MPRPPAPPEPATVGLIPSLFGISLMLYAQAIVLSLGLLAVIGSHFIYYDAHHDWQSYQGAVPRKAVGRILAVSGGEVNRTPLIGGLSVTLGPDDVHLTIDRGPHRVEACTLSNPAPSTTSLLSRHQQVELALWGEKVTEVSVAGHRWQTGDHPQAVWWQKSGFYFTFLGELILALLLLINIVGWKLILL